MNGRIIHLIKSFSTEHGCLKASPCYLHTSLPSSRVTSPAQHLPGKSQWNQASPQYVYAVRLH